MSSNGTIDLSSFFCILFVLFCFCWRVILLLFTFLAFDFFGVVVWLICTVRVVLLCWWEVGGGRWEVGGGRWEVGGGRWEVGGGRWEVGGGRWEVGGRSI